MAYRVEVDWAPAYELLTSLRAYADTTSQKLLDLGPGWARQTKALLPEEFGRNLVAVVEAVGGAPLALVTDCPVRHDARAFIRWLAELPLGDLYERVVTMLDDPAKLPPDLGALRDAYVALLTAWEACYFRTLDPQITAALAEDAAAKQSLVSRYAPTELVEEATAGLRLEDPDEVETVFLVPQYHGRPFNYIDWSAGRCLISYPVQALPPAPGAVPPDLRSLTRALGDDSRLLILRFLTGGVRSFTEIVKETGLAKSTVHHHMVTLRSCGLVRVHIRSTGTDRFSLRPGAIDSVGPRLHAFLKGE